MQNEKLLSAFGLNARLLRIPDNTQMSDVLHLFPSINAAPIGAVCYFVSLAARALTDSELIHNSSPRATRHLRP
jgi:hypothetical protein